MHSLGRVHLIDNTAAIEQMVCVPALNTVLLPTDVILVKGTDDERSWELNLTTLPGGLLYQLQEGLTNEL